MDTLFLRIFNVSITATWLVLALFVIRFLFKNAPKWLMNGLWGMVALRLLLPFSIESVFSVVPSRETIPQDILTSSIPRIDSGISFLNRAVNPILDARASGPSVVPPVSGSVSPPTSIAVSSALSLTEIASIVWIIGVAVMLLLAVVSYVRLRVQVRSVVRLEANVYQSERVSSPFVLGFIRPRIYLPFHVTDSDLTYVIAHERAHIKRKDHWIKPFAYLLLSVFWFNPVLWLAYILLGRDIEMACDEIVIRELSLPEKKRYSNVLLSFSESRPGIRACPLAFGQSSVKRRVVNVLSYKKPGFWIVLIALVCSLVVGMLFLTDPVRHATEEQETDVSETIGETDATDVSPTETSAPDSSDEENADVEPVHERKFTGGRFVWQVPELSYLPTDASDYAEIILTDDDRLTIIKADGEVLFDAAEPFERKVLTRQELIDVIQSSGDIDEDLRWISVANVEVLNYKTEGGLVYGIYRGNNLSWFVQGEILRIFELVDEASIVGELYANGDVVYRRENWKGVYMQGVVYSLKGNEWTDYSGKGQVYRVDRTYERLSPSAFIERFKLNDEALSFARSARFVDILMTSDRFVLIKTDDAFWIVELDDTKEDPVKLIYEAIDIPWRAFDFDGDYRVGKLLGQSLAPSHIPAEGELYDRISVKDSTFKILNNSGEISNFSVSVLPTAFDADFLRELFAYIAPTELSDLALPDGRIYVMTFAMKRNVPKIQMLRFSDGSMWFVENNYNRVFELENAGEEESVGDQGLLSHVFTTGERVYLKDRLVEVDPIFIQAEDQWHSYNNFVIPVKRQSESMSISDFMRSYHLDLDCIRQFLPTAESVDILLNANPYMLFKAEGRLWLMVKNATDHQTVDSISEAIAIPSQYFQADGSYRVGKLLEQAYHLSYLPAEGELYDHVRIASGALEVLDEDGEVEDWGPGSAGITTIELLKSWFEERPFASMPDIDLPDGFVYVITYTMNNSRHINHVVTFSDGSMWFIEDNFNRVFALEKRD